MLRPTLLALMGSLAFLSSSFASDAISLGPRAGYLVDAMDDSPLKSKLAACLANPAKKTDFSIGHRGAPLQFPEHTEQSYRAAARMGAGIMECDVTFTKDKELVCRHAQNDLHTTTNILATPLAEQCTAGFKPANSLRDAKAECRTSDISLSEFQTLTGKMDAANKKAETLEDYMNATAPWRTDLYLGQGGQVMTHKESIALFKELDLKFTPELKAPVVDMPYNGMSQSDYAQKLIDEYKHAGIPPEDVFPQSFNLDDILYWIENEPEFGKQAIYLDSSYRNGNFHPDKPDTFAPSMQELADKGVHYIAPPLWMLLSIKDGKIVPSAYAQKAKEAGLNIIAWSLERSGPLHTGGGWYYHTIKDAVKHDGMMLEVLHILAQDVGVKGVFSDWPATTTFYANCFDIP